MAMNKWVKRLIIILISLAALLLIGYGGYKLYNYALDVATKRIRKSVAKGVTQGVGDSINPLKWPGKIFGK
jgi:hypothetical protein